MKVEKAVLAFTVFPQTKENIFCQPYVRRRFLKTWLDWVTKGRLIPACNYIFDTAADGAGGKMPQLPSVED